MPKSQRLSATPIGFGGFAILELLIVIGIILGAFVLYFGRGTYNYQRPKQQACSQNLKTIHIALQTFASDNNDKFPSLTGAKSSEGPLAILIPRYTSRTDAFICPGSKDKTLPSGQSFKDRKISYSYCMGLDTKAAPSQWILSDALIDTNPHKKGDAIFSLDGKSPGDNHEKFGGVILFTDGSAEITPPRTEYAIEKPAGTTILNPAE